MTEYLFAFGLFIALFAAFRIALYIMDKKLSRFVKGSLFGVGDMIIALSKIIRDSFAYFAAFYIAVSTLDPHPTLWTGLTIVFIGWVVLYAARATQIIINTVVKKRFIEEGDNNAEGALDIIGMIAKGLVWVLGVLLILSNIGVNITSLIAGLGIGGVAIAFALQSILSDLFSSFAIYFDKPFKVGDFILVGNKMGIVKKIGIKTTRLQALQGEEVVISNNELTNSHIQNFGRMHERRVVFKFGIAYSTGEETIKSIQSEVKNIIDKAENARFDRCHFMEFAESSLNYEVVYYVSSPDYSIYMDIHQGILLGIKKAVESAGSSFAFPTRTVHVEKPSS